MYSGPVASHTYYHISESENLGVFIIAGPNHSGLDFLVATVVDYIWKSRWARSRLIADWQRR